MARERWFLAPTHKRQGPVPLAQLVEALLRLPDARACLVWRHGLPAWTAAGEVAEVDRHLAPFVAARKPAAPQVERAAEAASGVGRNEVVRPRPAGRAPAAVPPSPLVYLGAGAGAIVLAVLVWVFWPKSPAPKAAMTGAAPGIITLKEGSSSGAGAPSGSVPSGAAPVTAPPSGSAAPPSTTGGASTMPPRKATGAPAGSGAPATTPGAAGGAAQGGFAGWSDQEGQLPASELAKLRGVAGWSESSLELTVYNGSTWRITQLFVLPSRLKDDNFVDDDKPLGLLPAGAQVDQGVDKLLSKVAPDRRKPGVNPLDTGKFVAEAGSRPEAFRAPIVGALGYPPR
jgi:GYF domain 2